MDIPIYLSTGITHHRFWIIARICISVVFLMLCGPLAWQQVVYSVCAVWWKSGRSSIILTFWHYSSSILPFVEVTILFKMPNAQNNIDKPNSMNFNGNILYFKFKIGFLFERRISFEDNCANSGIVTLSCLLE